MQENLNPSASFIQRLLQQSLERESDSAEEAMKLAQSALELSRQLHVKELVWRSIMRVGTLMYTKRILVLDERDFLEGIQYAKETGATFDAIDLYLQLGTFYTEQSRVADALVTIQEALAISIEANDVAKEMLCLAHCSKAHYEMGDYDVAFEVGTRAIEIAQTRGDKKVLQSLYNNLGSLYHKLGRYQEALEHFNLSLEIRRELNTPLLIAFSLSNVGEVYRGLQQFDDALACLFEALTMAEELQNPRLLVHCKANIALVLEDVGNYNEAEDYCAQALNLATQTQPIAFVADITASLARIYLHNKKLELAADLFEQARILAVQNTLPDLLVRVYWHLSTICEQQQNFEQAYRWHKLCMETQTAMHNDEKEREIAKKERMLAIQKAEQAKLLLEKQLIQAEHSALRTQINPHFLFNSLNSIQSLLAEQQTEQALRYLSRFARLMRSILDNTRKASIALTDEIEIYKLYVEIEQLRFQNTFNFQLHIHPECVIEDMDIPPMIAQPFIENAIWHGLIPKKENAELILRINPLDSDRYILEIEDNGIGREQSQANKFNTAHTSAGIAIIRERLNLLGNLLQLTLSCSIHDVVQNNTCVGTRVSLVLPIHAIRL